MPDATEPFFAAMPDALLAPERLLTLLGLSFFLGLAWEEYLGSGRLKPPGGVRTFPLLAFAGALLYALAPELPLLFLGGLAVLGAWLSIWYWQSLAQQRAEPEPGEEPDTRLNGTIMAPLGNVIAYLLGAVVLTEPLWVAVAMAVAAVLLASAREKLHAFSDRMGGELFTLAKFLIIIGVVLPLVSNEPVTTLTAITPYQVWLAVVVVSTLSYVSYLVQRYLAPRRGLLYSAALGGLYSSTAITVLLSRQARIAKTRLDRLHAALVLSTAVMFLRILVVVAIFNLTLAKTLAPAIALLLLIGLGVAALLLWRHDRTARHGSEEDVLPPVNPLELQTALIFALLFVVLSLAVGWARTEFGEGSLFVIAALAGVTDVDPLVLNVAQGAAPLHFAAAAILIAAASNNVLKGGYMLIFAGRRAGLVPALALLLLAGIGLAAAFLMLAPA